jgi:hypothetical protein
MMAEINEEVSRAVEREVTIRVLVDVPTEFLDPQNYLGSASNLIEALTAAWERSAATRQLVVEVYPRRSYIALDINNSQYNYATAHKQFATIPVYILQQSRKSRGWKIFRAPSQDKPVAERIAELHRCNGQNSLPFLEDHIQGPVHLSPRKS